MTIKTYDQVDIFVAITQTLKPILYPDYSSMEVDEWAGKILEALSAEDVPYEYEPENCPHDYLISECAGCGYRAG